MDWYPIIHRFCISLEKAYPKFQALLMLKNDDRAWLLCEQLFRADPWNSSSPALHWSEQDSLQNDPSRSRLSRLKISYVTCLDNDTYKKQHLGSFNHKAKYFDCKDRGMDCAHLFWISTIIPLETFKWHHWIGADEIERAHVFIYLFGFFWCRRGFIFTFYELNLISLIKICLLGAGYTGSRCAN